MQSLWFMAVIITRMGVDIGSYINGKLHPKAEWACFVHYCKIINTFWQNNINTLKQVLKF